MYDGAYQAQKRASDLLELELQGGYEPHVGIRSQTQVLCKTNSPMLNCPPAPTLLFLKGIRETNSPSVL